MSENLMKFDGRFDFVFDPQVRLTRGFKSPMVLTALKSASASNLISKISLTSWPKQRTKPRNKEQLSRFNSALMITINTMFILPARKVATISE